MRRRAWSALLLLGPLAATAQTFPVPPELWDRPRSAAVIRSVPTLRQAVIALIAQPGGRLVVHHAAGPEAQLQAEELRAWLMVLAIDGEQIALQGDLNPRDTLSLEVTH